MDQKEEIKSKVDIVEVISGYIPLKKSGRNLMGLCPFHSEKTPSFVVSPERQIFRCFGCGEGGDVFTFLEKIEGWDFREALEELAGRVGVKLKTQFKSDGSVKRERIIKINSLVNKFYSHLLTNHKLGELARNYLINRGIKKPSWEKFGLGFAPNGWEITLNFLKKRGFDLSDMVSAGLVIARSTGQQSYYDRFRNRLIFPLKDSRGITLGFSARVIEPARKDEPKYINTPQTEVFNKGSLLFGLDLAREAIRKKKEAILTEGEFDVISLYQAGIQNVIASKGTALTDKQVAIISRMTSDVVLAYDTDLAGDAASRRGIELLDLAGVNLRVLKMGKYKDPDEYIQADKEGLVRSIEKAVNVYDYFLSSATARFDVTTANGKKALSAELIPVLGKISVYFCKVIRPDFVLYPK